MRGIIRAREQGERGDLVFLLYIGFVELGGEVFEGERE